MGLVENQTSALFFLEGFPYVIVDIFQPPSVIQCNKQATPPKKGAKKRGTKFPKFVLTNI